MTGTGKLSTLITALAASAALAGGVAGQAGASVAAGHDGHAARLRAGVQFPVPAVGLAKSASISSYSAAGTPVTYTYEVTNTGDMTLSSVTVTDPMPGLSAIDCGGGTNVIASLAVGASHACTATYTTTAQDVTNGSITNVGTATSAGPTGTVSDNSSLTIPEVGRAFTCKTPTHYLSQSTGSSGPTQLYYASPNGTPPPLYTYSPLGPGYGHVYNALGFNPTDNYLYALAKTGGTPQLLKIDSAGNVTSLGTISTGLQPPVAFSAVGAFDASGNYWIRAGSTAGGTTAYEIDVSTSPPSLISTLTLSASFKALDWTLDPAYPNYLWGLSGHTIYQASITTGAVASFNTGLSVAPSTYGAAWTFGNGNLGFSNNATGQINEISVSGPVASPSFTLVSQYYGPGVVTVNDGAACIGKGTDLGIVKTGPATVAAGGTINWDLTVTNNGPANSSGFAVDDAIPAGVTGVTTSDPNCTVASKGRDVECAGTGLDNGDSYIIPLSGIAPAKTGVCVVNTATVTGNEADPNPANDSSGVETCTTSASTWTVRPGGQFSAKAGKVVLTDTATGASITCTSSAGSGAFLAGSGLPGTGIGTVSALSFSSCGGPLGLTFTMTAAALPWALNALSYNASTGVMTGTMTGMDITLIATGCSADVDGTLAGADNGQVSITHTNSSGQLKVLTTGGNLHIYNVSGCAGLINSADPATLTASYAMGPAQTITSP